MSWRDDTPQAVQDDLDGILDEALRAAQHFLEKNGEFFPFAVTLDAGGQMTMVAADPGEGEQPASQSVLDMLYAGAADDRDRLRAVAFVAPVEADGQDEVRVETEHRDGGPAIAAFLPYATKRLRRSVTFGELTAGTGERRVWPEG